MGHMVMECIFNIGKNISIWAKVTQVSDVAHMPLVFLKLIYNHYVHVLVPLIKLYFLPF
jgi:hypothetical protein